jgi:hypothetical protein
MKTKFNVHARHATSQHGEGGILEYIVSGLGEKTIPFEEIFKAIGIKPEIGIPRRAGA